MKKLMMTEKDVAELGSIVRKIKLFANMNMGLLEKILNRVNLYQYGKGEKICKQGETGDSFYVVSAGRVNVSVKSGFFSSKTIAELGPGDCLGEMALLNRAPRNATAVCAEDAKLFVLLADNFDQVVDENPIFREEIKKLAAERSFELKRAQ